MVYARIKTSAMGGTCHYGDITVPPVSRMAALKGLSQEEGRGICSRPFIFILLKSFVVVRRSGVLLRKQKALGLMRICFVTKNGAE